MTHSELGCLLTPGMRGRSAVSTSGQECCVGGHDSSLTEPLPWQSRDAAVTGWSYRLPLFEIWSTSGPAQPGAIAADGCMDLVTDGSRVSVAGPDSTGRWFIPTGPEPMWGVRFHPGLLPGVLRLPACELTDRVVPLADVSGLGVLPEDLRDPVALRRLCSSEHLDQSSLQVATMLMAGRTIDDVALAANWSTRQLRRLSHAWFGYGPKHLQRVLRLRRAEKLLAQGVSVAATAAGCGYADASHLWRDRREFAARPC